MINSTIMDTKQRLELSKLIKEYDADDNTERIRSLKHSALIREDITIIQELKRKYPRMYQTSKDNFKKVATSKANFLFTNYTNIFNRLLKDQLNLDILWQFLEVLRNIEDGTIDQHEGSYKVGVLLKNLYIDSVVQQDEKVNSRKTNKKSSSQSVGYKKISWAEFKQTNQ